MSIAVPVHAKGRITMLRPQLSHVRVSSPSLLRLGVTTPLINAGSSNRIVALFGGVSWSDRASIVGAGVSPLKPSGTAGGKRETLFDEPERPVCVALCVRVRARWNPFPTGMVIPCTMIEVRIRK
jgi:hypothetical protein